MTPETISICTGARIDRAQRFAAELCAGMAIYRIDTPARQAAFLAQIGHESGGLRYTTELWGPTPAQIRYEGRTDLGNVQPGDGSRFRGHGLIQVTGRANHARATYRLRQRFGSEVPDFEINPEALAEPRWTVLSACDFWDDKNLNVLADAGDFLKITRVINGGINGLADRQALYASALRALS